MALVMDNKSDYIPFSQRNGLSPIPSQLKVGQVSSELRRLFEYSFSKEIDPYEYYHRPVYRLMDPWKHISSDYHVKFLGKSVTTFNNDSHVLRDSIGDHIENGTVGPLFDLIEFFIRHPDCSKKFKAELVDAFVIAKAAYRVIDNQIVTIGTEEQAKAFKAAISDTESVGALAARRHLVEAGAALRNASWADSVRESIHAVESMAKRINPEARTLGEALKTIERSGYIHGSLKAAFEKLYGYTNDEDGIRHALSDAESRVDETDALFMLGACASFVSYLIAREANHAANGQR